MDVFSPAFRKKKEQAVWETVSAQLPEIGKSWNVRGTFLALRYKLETQAHPVDVFTPR